MSQNNSKKIASYFTEGTLTAADFNDQAIVCLGCDKEFVWTAGEQAFYYDKRLPNPPKRCRDCKKAKNDRIESVIAAQAAGVKQKIEVAVNCVTCQCPTTVPFYPSQGRPVYCRTCYIKMNPNIFESPPNKNNGNGNRNNNF